MSIKVIYSDLGDVDCASIPLLWKGIPDVDVLRLADDTNYTKEDVHNAIKEADDTLIMCGHGTPRGLLGFVVQEFEERPYSSWGFDYGMKRGGKVLSMAEEYAKLKQNEDLPGEIGPMAEKKADEPKPKKYTRHVMDTVVNSSMAKDIHAKRVIAVWCHASEFAEANHLYGFWSSMFISNSGEARACGFPGVPNQTIVDETYKFWRDANVLLKNDVPLSEWIDRLVEVGNMDYPTTRFNYDGLRYYP